MIIISNNIPDLNYQSFSFHCHRNYSDYHFHTYQEALTKNSPSFFTTIDLHETNDADHPIISEEEFKVRQKMKDASSGYKVDFDELTNLKTEIKYIKKKVDQSRDRLVKGINKPIIVGFILYYIIYILILFEVYLDNLNICDIV